MKLELKKYKHYKINNYFKSQKIFFVYNINDLNFKNWLNIQQDLHTKNLKSFKLNNNLTINVLNHSIFKNLSSIINGSIIILGLNKNVYSNFSLLQLQNLNMTMTFLNLKLNNKIYVSTQLSKIKTFNYNIQIILFTKSLKKFFKQPYYKLKNRNNVI